MGSAARHDAAPRQGRILGFGMRIMETLEASKVFFWYLLVERNSCGREVGSRSHGQSRIPIMVDEAVA